MVPGFGKGALFLAIIFALSQTLVNTLFVTGRGLVWIKSGAY